MTELKTRVLVVDDDQRLRRDIQDWNRDLERR